MARGNSGRIVIDVDPELKKQLYVALAEKEMTMKDWFIQAAESLLQAGRRQRTLWDAEEEER